MPAALDVTPASLLAVMAGILPAIAAAGCRRADRLEGGVTAERDAPALGASALLINTYAL